MAKKLYVGNLSYDTTSDSLQAAFAQAGTVTSCQIIMDKMSGRSKGFGFVEMSTDEEATAAIDMWNGKELDGRALTVNEARPMEPRAPRTGGGGGYGNKGNW
jgi:RNA recognition motif-containing protein